MLKNRIYFALMMCVLVTAASAQTNWWNPTLNYRLPVVVETLGGTSHSHFVAVPVNFTTTLREANNRRPFNAESLRVVEVTADGKLMDDNIVAELDRAPNYHPTTNAQGQLRIWLKAAPQSTRYFRVYFDTAASANTVRLIAKKETTWRYQGTAALTRGGEPLVTLGSLEFKPGPGARNIVAEPLNSEKSPNESPLRPSWIGKPEHRFFDGYCTWYAARKWKEFTGMPVTWSGDGGRWFDNAASEGRNVSADPRAAVRGAVIVWTRARAAGHVAFVEAVTDDGIFISEMNAHGLWVVSEAFLPFTNLDKGTKYKFKGYVLPQAETAR